MVDVRFHPFGAKYPLKFVVIYAVSGGKAVWGRHRERVTWELPGGHIETGEDAFAAAARELREETGASVFALEPLCVYSVAKDGAESFGAFFRAEVSAFGTLENEIEEIALADAPPGEWTYPAIHPFLTAKAREIR